jgi:hypothetical protein
MSGGSYGYIYSRLKEECDGRMYDVEMNDLIKDLCNVLHDLEWWQSCDTSEERYRLTLERFKTKWFKGDREQRLKGYIDEQIDIVRYQLYSLIGEPQESEKRYTPEEVGEILIEEGQEHGRKWCDITRFTSSEVVEILKAESEV